jgi:hypothetical protein
MKTTMTGDEFDREMSRNTWLLTWLIFMLALGFVIGYGFKLFEKTVNMEVANMKLQNCHRLIVKDVYANGDLK